MPSKTKSTKTIEDPVLDEADTPKKRRISFNSLSRINVIYILFLLLIIASFLIGVLVTKVQYLEKGGATDTITQAINDGSALQAPTGPVDVDQGHLAAQVLAREPERAAARRWECELRHRLADKH